jgi:hypothetical protein
MKRYDITSFLLMLIETVLLISIFSIPFSFTDYIAGIIFAFFAWSFHWLAHFSVHISRNNRFAGFFITLLFLSFFAISFVFSIFY